MRLLVFAASFRRESFNKRLARLAADAATRAGAAVDLADFRAFEMPLYDADLEAAQGLPAGAIALRDRLVRADGLVLATPEYNHSIPGPTKNAIDWLSRAKPSAMKGRPVLLLSASSGLAGGSRATWALRTPLEYCGMYVFPEHLAVPRAGDAFTEDGAFRDPALATRLDRLMKDYLRFADAVSALVPRRAVTE